MYSSLASTAQKAVR
jgi:hypothetical protein